MKTFKVSTFCTYFAVIGTLSLTYYALFRTENSESVLIKSLKKDEITDKNDIYIAEIESVDCQTVTNRLNAAKVNSEDPELVRLIRDCYIESPSGLRYNLSHPESRKPSGQAAFVDATLNQMDGGIFVDCGANTGEGFSNSLFLERYRNWSGILIEANPSLYKELRIKNRKAFTLNACLNSMPYPSEVTFLEDSWWGNIVQGNYSKTYRGISRKGQYIKVQCFPLQSILLALNQTKVDYFSLDVEGAEKGVLDSMPWDKLDIKMMSIEYNKWPGGKDSLKTYMKGKGYKCLTEIHGRAAADIVVLKEILK